MEEENKPPSSMEIDPVPVPVISNTTSCVMASSGTVGSVSVSLHPLVIMNISEHWTRLRAQEQKDGPSLEVIGALIGKQKGRDIEIMNSFELVYSIVEEDVIIDREYYNIKEEQFKQVFSDMDFLGWYTAGDTPDAKDIKIHKQICEINESPVFLKLNPLARHTDQLPVSMYESVIDLLNGQAVMLFVQLQYTLATEEAERIGVDHVARVSINETGESSLVAEHLTAQHSAIKMLHSRVKLVLEYVKAVQEGRLPENTENGCMNHHEIMREAYALSHRLPILQSSQFQTELYNYVKAVQEGRLPENTENGCMNHHEIMREAYALSHRLPILQSSHQCNDVGLMAYLGVITKGCNDCNQLINKFNFIYDRQGIKRIL